MKLLLTCFKCHQETALLTYEENRMYKVSCPCGCEYTFEHSSMACAESYHLREVELHGEIDHNRELTAPFAVLQAENAELRAALSRVEAERDAAISDVPHDCEHCKHATEDGACKLLPDGDQFSPDYTEGFDRDGNCDHWEWRGAQGEG